MFKNGWKIGKCGYRNGSFTECMQRDTDDLFSVYRLKDESGSLYDADNREYVVHCLPGMKICRDIAVYLNLHDITDIEEAKLRAMDVIENTVYFTGSCRRMPYRNTIIR